MYVYSNVRLIGRMNEHDVFFGASGCVSTDASWKAVGVCSPFSRVYFVDGGRAKLHTAEKDIFLEPGRVYLIPAGLTYDYEGFPSVNKLFFHVNVFKPDGFDLMLDMHTVGELPCSVERIAHLRTLYESETFADAMTLKGYVTGVLSDMITAYHVGAGSTENYSALVRDTMQYIRTHLSMNLNTANLAERHFVSVSTLSKAFKTETGRTVGAYIDDLVMFSAQRKLLRTDLSVGEVSEKLGFCDQFYFSRYFKRRCGESPLKYRKRMRAVDFGDEPNITFVRLHAGTKE